MHDIRFLRADPRAFDAALGRRGLDPIADDLLALDETHRRLSTEAQTLQARRNEASKEIGRLKREGGDADPLVAEVATIKTRLPQIEEEAKAAAEALDAKLAELPNLPAEDVPDGPDETANVEVSRWGEPIRSNTVRQHFDLGEAWGDLDFEAAAALSGSRFVVVRRDIARLARALGQFMLDTHVDENGYTEIQPPYLVRDHVLFGTGQLPKFAEDLFEVPGSGHWLIPTAEVPLTNLAAGRILDDAADLPMRMTALTPCFRAEAGAAGRDTRGIIRQHQFDKVELVTVCRPEDSVAEHDRMLAAAEGILQALGLAYRVVSLCTGDLGFGARKTYDIEVWLPGQGQYREISSISNCGDFQARRMNARCRPKGEKQTRFVHTLNGSGVAVGRALVAVLETYQNEDGSLTVPEVLRGYLKGRERLGP